MTDTTDIGLYRNGSPDAANEVMTPAMRLFQLQTKHRSLDARIHEMYEFPYQNQILLQRLKKEKLRLKDAITRLKDDMIPDLNA
ncbi:MAG: YdcH family protein [Halioglobus sp.]